MKRFSGVLTLALLAALAGCSEGGGPAEPAAEQLNPQVNADLVAVAADGVAEEVEIMRAPGFDWRIGSFGGPPADPEFGPCHQTCSFTREGLTISRTLTYYDASGTEMAAYDATQTASVKIVSSVKGSVSRWNRMDGICCERNFPPLFITCLQGDLLNDSGKFVIVSRNPS